VFEITDFTTASDWERSVTNWLYFCHVKLKAVMWCLEAALRQNFHCLSLGLGLDPCSLGLGLGLV